MNSIKSFIQTIRTEIAVYWEKCFYSLEQRQAFAPYHAGQSSGTSVCGRGSGSVGVSAPPLFPDDFTEELLNLHEAEVKTLEQYYEHHRELFDGVTKWQENWTLYLELDVSTEVVQQSVFGGATRGNQLFFAFRKKTTTLRGSTTEAGTFSKKRSRELTCRRVCPRSGHMSSCTWVSLTPKTTNSCVSSLFQLEKSLKAQIDTWEQERGTEFQVNGQQFLEYVQQQWDRHHGEKEKEKLERVSDGRQASPWLVGQCVNHPASFFSG